MSVATDKHKPLDKVRLDKWLWTARFFKSRSLASEAVSGGKVSCNGERGKPGKMVKVGDRLIIRRGVYEYTVDIQALSKQRLAAKLAQELYLETDESVAARALRQEQVKIDSLGAPKVSRRPSKRDRRQLMANKYQRD